MAFHTFLAKNAHRKAEHPEQGSSGSESGSDTRSDPDKIKGKIVADSSATKRLGTDLGHLNLESDLKDTSRHNLLPELADSVVDFNNEDSDSNQQAQPPSYSSSSDLDPRYSCNMEGPSSIGNLLSETDGIRTPRSYVEMPLGAGAPGVAIEGPSEEGSCYHMDNNNWLVRDQSRLSFSSNTSCNGLTSSGWGRYSTPLFSWGGRVVGGRRLKAQSKGKYGVLGDEHEAFVNIFEGGSLLYCNMSFEALLNVRKQLEELGFPCKAVNDGLWLQV